MSPVPLRGCHPTPACSAAAQMAEVAAQRVRALPAASVASFPKEVDLVVSGGGFKVCVAGGVLYTLEQAGVRVVRAAGASAGAHVGFLMLHGMLTRGLHWALCVAQTFSRFPLAHPEPMWAHFYGNAASEVPVPPPGHFMISLCEIVRWWPAQGVRRRRSEYRTRGEVAQGLLATAAVPLLLTSGRARRYGGVDVLDGGLTDNCPIFEPHDRPRPIVVVHYDDLPAELTAGANAGIFYSFDQMLRMARLGIASGERLLAGEASAPCVALVSPTRPETAPAATRRTREKVFLLQLAYATLATYQLPAPLKRLLGLRGHQARPSPSEN